MSNLITYICILTQNIIHFHKKLYIKSKHKIKAVCHFKNTAFIVLQIKYRTWHCRCDCGNETNVITQHLLKSMTTSCGCYAKEQSVIRGINRAEDLTGQVFGYLKVISLASSNPDTRLGATAISPLSYIK